MSRPESDQRAAAAHRERELTRAAERVATGPLDVRRSRSGGRAARGDEQEQRTDPDEQPLHPPLLLGYRLDTASTQ